LRAKEKREAAEKPNLNRGPPECTREKREKIKRRRTAEESKNRGPPEGTKEEEKKAPA
jgi:hypothetical protein